MQTFDVSWLSFPATLGLTVTDPTNGCSNSTSINITQTSTAPAADAGPDISICASANIPLMGTGVGSYLWTPNIGLSCNTCANPLASPTVTTTYSLAVTNGCGTSTDEIIVIVNYPPSVSVAGYIAGTCPNNAEADAINGTPPYTYLWNDPAAQTTQTATNLGIGTYTVTVADYSGCVNTATVAITAAPLNIAITSVANNACPDYDGTATANVTGGTSPYTYLWNDPGVQTTQTAGNLGIGSYTVTVTDALGCIASGATIINNGIVFDYSNGYTTTNGEFWNFGTTLKINGIITVPAGTTFTISHGTKLEFAQNSGIVVEHDATLVMTGSTTILKGLSGCNNMWNGIVLEGNINGNDYAGTLEITSATVRDAVIGVDARAGFKFNWSTTGTVKANGASFINNRVGIQMKGRETIHSHSSINSFITSCQFLCNAPLLDAVTFGGEGTKNFIQLDDIRELNTFNNNSFTGYSAFSADKQGTGVSSINSYFTSQGNAFSYLTRGITSATTNILGNIIVNQNNFDNVQQGVYDENSTANVYTANTFANIPSADALGSIGSTNLGKHTYGIYMISSGGFEISGNNTFSGTASTVDPIVAGSHGIVFENTGASGAVCFDNTFNGTDYGVHMQGTDNSNLKIRCNHFAYQNSGPHQVSAWYTYSGSLRDQGSSACGTSTTAKYAAGNTWESTGTGTQDVYTTVNFNYYANDHDQSGGTTTIPVATTSTISLWTGLNTSCFSASGLSTCVDGSIGLAQPVVGTAANNNFRSALNNDSLLWLLGEQQLEINRLLRLYLQNSDSISIITLLNSSGTAESEKLLSQYYLGIQNYSGSRISLDNVASATISEGIYRDSLGAAANAIENANFIMYMNVMIDLAEAGKTIPELDSIQLHTLHDIANAHVKVSASAEVALTIALNEYFAHPILKSNAGQNKDNSNLTNIENGNLKKNELLIYPNPFSETTTVEYVIPEGMRNSILYLYDPVGNQIKAYPITNNGGGKILIDGTPLANGIYSCHLVSDNKIIGVNKLVIIK